MDFELEVLFFVSCLAVFSSVNGCGLLPQQQGRAISFNVTGFKLPAAMVYSMDNSSPSRAPTISTSEQQGVSFVQNTVMRSVEDVLYQQGRGAGLSDDAISLILNQVDVVVKYTPLKCDIVFTDQMGMGIVMDMVTNCQIIDGTVTKTCRMPMGNNNMAPYQCLPAMLTDIESMYLSISGSITTTNIIMANWSTQMWQIVLNRVLRSFTIGPLRSQFIGASVTLN